MSRGGVGRWHADEAARSEARNAALIADIDAGLRYIDVAAKYSISIARVGQIRVRHNRALLAGFTSVADWRKAQASRP